MRPGKIELVITRRELRLICLAMYLRCTIGHDLVLTTQEITVLDVFLPMALSHVNRHIQANNMELHVQLLFHQLVAIRNQFWREFSWQKKR